MNRYFKVVSLTFYHPPHSEMNFIDLEILRAQLVSHFRVPKYVVAQLDKKWEKLDSGELEYWNGTWSAEIWFDAINTISITGISLE